jgi:hypothetical protein
MLLAEGRTAASAEGIPTVHSVAGATSAADQATRWRLMSGLAALPPSFQRDAAEAQSLPSTTGSPATAATSDSWLELPPPVRYGAVGMYDSTGDRLFICGGAFGSPRTDIWCLDLAQPGQWVRVPAGGDLPPPQYSAATAIDLLHHRIFFIGVDYPRETFGDTYSLDLSGAPHWTRISQANPATGPAVRGGASAIYDSRRDRLVLFGGFGRGHDLADTWSLDIPTGQWSPLPAGGDSIEPHDSAPAVYDSDHDRMLVYGGWIEGPPNDFRKSDELWALQFGPSPAWHHVITTGDYTDARIGGGLIRDPHDGSILLVGGAGWEGPAARGDFFRFTESATPTWSRVVHVGSPSQERFASAVAYDSRRDRFLFFGGESHPLDRLDVDILTPRPSPTWTTLGSDPLPPGRSGQAMAVDSKRDRLTTFGGGSSTSYLGDVWTAPLENPGLWTPLAIPGPAPPPRAEPVMVYDPLRDRMVIFGGQSSSELYLDDTWVLTLDPTPAWAQAQHEGGAPPGRVAHAAIYDPLRDEMLVFCGYGAAGFLGDVWALHLADPMRWERLQPGGPGPSARGFASAIYDPTRDRVILYGGANSWHALNETWALPLKNLQWERLADGSSSPAFAGHSAIYDPEHDRMVVFGGWVVVDDFYFSAAGSTENLEFEPSPHWSSESFGDGAPTRTGHTAAYDAHRSRMVVFGGGIDNDSWILDFGGGRFEAWLVASSTTEGTATLVWQATPAVPSPLQVERSSLQEPWHVVGGIVADTQGRVSFRDVGLTPATSYRYRLSGPAGPLSVESSVASAAVPRLQVLGAWPNPASASALTVRFALASANPATVEIFDLAGRHLELQRLAPRGSGVTSAQPHESLRPGIYVVRLTQDGHSVTGKFCVLR